MIILGIDPGTASTGYGAVVCEGSKIKVLDYGVISTPVGRAPHLRLKTIYDDLLMLFDAVQPAEISIERLFFSTNARTAISVGEARGVALLAAAAIGVDIGEYTPLQVKQAVVGYGKATKAQVQYMVKALLCLKEKPRPDDAADGLALAICHAHSRKLARHTG